MSVKIRLQRRGRKQRPLYHIIIADSRSPRDGRFIEKIGVYNPLTKPATIEIDRDRAFDWLMKGAEPTDTVRAILRFKGVLYRKHLSRGVARGAFSQEEADAKYQAWIDEKEAHIEQRRKASTDEIAQFHVKRSGKAAPKKVEEEAPAEEALAADEVAAVAEVAATETAETPAAEVEAPAAEAEAPAEEAAPEAEATAEAETSEAADEASETTKDEQ